MSEAFQLKKGVSIEERHGVKKAFFVLYRKSGNCKASAEKLHLSLKTAYTWVSAYKDNGNRIVKEARHGRANGEKRTLSPEQEFQLVGYMVDHDPKQYKLPFALWNARAIQLLIQDKFGITMPSRTVCCYMKRLGFTPQRPEKRAREQQPAKVEKWMKHNYPRIHRAARKISATIYWGDETSVCGTECHVRGYAPKGQTPIVRTLANKGCRFNMISAISAQGKMNFKLYSKPITVLKYIRFLTSLIKESGRKVILIVDNLRVHHAKIVKAWVKKHRHEIRVFYLPAYSPELNPDEYLNSDLKRAIQSDVPARDKQDLETKVSAHMARRIGQPEIISNLFDHQSVQYIKESDV